MEPAKEPERTFVDLDRYITGHRFDASRNHRLEDVIWHVASDRSRIVYSPAFRRLQQKAQVFSLEDNAAVRSRLTHSIEVSDVGRRMGMIIWNELKSTNHIHSTDLATFITLIENGCLLHDIGNPPFGHFGEEAIKVWFADHGITTAKSSLGRESLSKETSEILFTDFKHFDGNPQGLRISTKLYTDQDQYSLNLTYSTILSSIKYPISTHPKFKNVTTWKKRGIFVTEELLINKAISHFSLNLGQRHPIAFICEAADDIAYCLSDLQDGIEKGIVDPRDLIVATHLAYRELAKIARISEEFPVSGWNKSGAPVDSGQSFSGYTTCTLEAAKMDYFFFSIKCCQYLIGIGATQFSSCFRDQQLENRDTLFLPNTPAGVLLKALKQVARTKLFRSYEAESIEIAGYSIIMGILNCLKPLLAIPAENWNLLLEAKTNPDALRHKSLDYQWRLANRLPEKYIRAYKYQVEQKPSDGLSKDEWEWLLRAHLVVDFISGMTDDFAQQFNRLVNGEP